MSYPIYSQDELAATSVEYVRFLLGHHESAEDKFIPNVMSRGPELIHHEQWFASVTMTKLMKHITAISLATIFIGQDRKLDGATAFEQGVAYQPDMEVRHINDADPDAPLHYLITIWGKRSSIDAILDIKLCGISVETRWVTWNDAALGDNILTGHIDTFNLVRIDAVYRPKPQQLLSSLGLEWYYIDQYDDSSSAIIRDMTSIAENHGYVIDYVHVHKKGKES
jgi:hypothetical protein